MSKVKARYSARHGISDTFIASYYGLRGSNSKPFKSESAPTLFQTRSKKPIWSQKWPWGIYDGYRWRCWETYRLQCWSVHVFLKGAMKNLTSVSMNSKIAERTFEVLSTLRERMAIMKCNFVSNSWNTTRDIFQKSQVLRIFAKIYCDPVY